MSLIVSRTACRPRLFGGKTGADLDFDYHANKKDWMTNEVFFGLAERLDSYIRRIVVRKIFLLVNRCPADGKKGELPPLEIV